MTTTHSQLSKRLGYTFKDTALAELALTHRSHGTKNNERLEFLGDSIVNFLIAEALYQQFPKVSEGDLSHMRSQLVRKETLFELAKKLHLSDHIKLGSGEFKSGGAHRDSILADTVEALIAAIYLDSDIEQCRQCVCCWYAEKLTNASLHTLNQKDAKTALQEFLQARKKPLPIYTLLNTTGSDHHQQFEIVCHVSLLDTTIIGKGNRRRHAEQAAASEALRQLQATTKNDKSS